MSHISECYYKSKVEKTEKSGNTITHICSYELIDGGYLVFKDVREVPDNKEDYYMDGKKIKTYAKASDEPPSEVIAEEKSENLKKLFSVIKNMG